MKKILFLVLGIVSCWYGFQCSKKNEATLNALPSTWEAPANRSAFINRWKITAVKLSQKDGIPASIRMAQAILESSDGSSKLAHQGNYFGIKCFKAHDHGGRHCVSGEGGYYKTYSNPASCWAEHADILHAKRYAALHGEEYPAWATGLVVCGYAEDTNYPRKLITLIDRHQLSRLDHQPHAPSVLFISIGIVLGLLGICIPITLGEHPAYRGVIFFAQ